MANAAGIVVIGTMKEAGGLKDSLSKFRKHSNAVGAALMNLTEGRDEEDDRPAYAHQSYPKMLYRADGMEVTVKNEEMEQYYINDEGYRTRPYPKIQIALADAASEKKAVETNLLKKDGELRSMQEQNDLLMSRLRKLESVVVKAGLLDLDDEEIAPAAKKTATKKAS